MVNPAQHYLLVVILIIKNSPLKQIVMENPSLKFLVKLPVKVALQQRWTMEIIKVLLLILSRMKTQLNKRQ